METRAHAGRSRWMPLLLVGVGGTIGAGAREALSLVIPPAAGVPLAIAVINVAGAFILGYLYEALSRPGLARKNTLPLRLLVGTGFCGGFTTYSTLASDTVALGIRGDTVLAIVYALGTVVLGATATWAGIAIAAHRNSRHSAQPGEQETATV